MAGSYYHVAGNVKEGHSHDSGWSLVENMGDAYETVEELLWLVRRLAAPKRIERLLEDEYYPMRRGERPEDKALTFVKEAMSR